jgi:uncharacterized protein
MGLRLLSLLHAGLLASLAPSTAHAQSERPANDSTVLTITGTGERFVRPNAASMVLAFSAVDSTLTRAGQRVAVRADSIRRALEKLGIARDSVVSASSWYWWRERVESLTVETGEIDTTFVVRNGKRIENGWGPRRRPIWRVRDRLQVRIADPSVVGRVFDAMLALGISDISDIRFTRTNDPVLADSLLQEAVRDARRRAELIATASGMRLDRLLEVSTDAFRSRYDSDDGLSMVEAASVNSGEGNTEIRPRALRVATTVHTRWRLAPR